MSIRKLDKSHFEKGLTGKKASTSDTHLWCLKWATGEAWGKLRRSQTFRAPSSPPEASMKLVSAFQDSTFTSTLWASTVSMFLAARVSQILIVLSEEHEAMTFSSVGLHCMSSTELV